MNYKKTISDFEKKGKKETRKLKDVEYAFRDKVDVEEILKMKNIPVYETFTKDFSPIKLTLTEVNPGSIHGEFYLTKGHIHKNKTPEFYVLLEGKGILLLQKEKKTRKILMKIGKINLIPEGYAHRIINYGKTKLKVLSVYHEASKPDYHVEFKKRFFR